MPIPESNLYIEHEKVNWLCNWFRGCDLKHELSRACDSEKERSERRTLQKQIEVGNGRALTIWWSRSGREEEEDAVEEKLREWRREEKEGDETAKIVSAATAARYTG